MVKKCIVKACHDYYTNQKKVRLFRSLQKRKERERWIKARDNKPRTFNYESNFPSGYESLVIREKVQLKTPQSEFHNLV